MAALRSSLRLSVLLPTLTLLVLVVGLGSRAARAGENPLDPSPHRSSAEALRHVAERTAEASPPEAADVVGAVTKLPGRRLGFMPLLQHHMAVEHWFLEGVKASDLTEAFAGTNRCFVRLRGRLTLLGVFGGSGLEWYGNGLEHGRDWGPVMGYHERVYEFRVEEVVWARDRNTHLHHQAVQSAAGQRVRALLDRLEYAEALLAIREAIEGHRDTGFDTRDLVSLEAHAVMMGVLLADPASWAPEDEDVVVAGLRREPSTPFRELKKGAGARLVELIATWPDTVHLRLAPRVVEGWMQVEYRHVRDGLRPIVAAFRAPEVEAWKTRLAEAEAKVEAAKKRMDVLRGTGEYAELLRVLESVQPYQTLLLDYALTEKRTSGWAAAARRLAALTEAWEGPTRVDLLVQQVRDTIASRGGLPNSNEKPRYNEEIGLRFAARLAPEERRQVEAVLLEIAQPLTPRDHWQEILLVGELLSIFGGEDAKEFFPTLLARSRGSPKWQRDHLQRFADALYE